MKLRKLKSLKKRAIKIKIISAIDPWALKEIWDRLGDLDKGDKAGRKARRLGKIPRNPR